MIEHRLKSLKRFHKSVLLAAILALLIDGRIAVWFYNAEKTGLGGLAIDTMFYPMPFAFVTVFFYFAWFLTLWGPAYLLLFVFEPRS